MLLQLVGNPWGFIIFQVQGFPFSYSDLATLLKFANLQARRERKKKVIDALITQKGGSCFWLSTLLINLAQHALLSFMIDPPPHVVVFLIIISRPSGMSLQWRRSLEQTRKKKKKLWTRRPLNNLLRRTTTRFKRVQGTSKRNSLPNYCYFAKKKMLDGLSGKRRDANLSIR